MHALNTQKTLCTSLEWTWSNCLVCFFCIGIRLIGDFIWHDCLGPGHHWGSQRVFLVWNCCAFRGAILQALLATGAYLTSCCLSMTSDQSAHFDLWPLTSPRRFPPHTWRSLDNFLSLGIFPVNPRGSCDVKIEQQPVWLQRPPSNSNLKLPFLAILMQVLNFSESSLSRPHTKILLPCD